MPSRKQQLKIWEAQFKIFGGSGVPQQTYHNTSGEGLVEQKHPDIDNRRSYKSGGKKVGKLEYDIDKKEIILK